MDKELIVKPEIPQNVMMFNQDAVTTAIKWCTHIAASALVPEHFRNKIDNVFLAFYKAQRLGMDPIGLMESSYIIHGKLGYEAKLIIALINASGLFNGLLKFKFSGEIKRDKNNKVLAESTRECTAYAIEKLTGQNLEMSCPISMAFFEGWTNDKGGKDGKQLQVSKWHTMTDNMLMYRAASFFGKMYCPQLITGMNSREELEDSPQDAEFTDVDTEHAKELFTKGATETPDVHPVLDPAKEVKAAVQEQTMLELPGTEDDPPKMPKFRQWFLDRFKNETMKIDAILIEKKCIDSGECALDLTSDQLTNIREKWTGFIKYFNEWKKP